MLNVLVKPTKVKIVLNPNKKTPKQIRAETGADYVINGGYFNLKTVEPTGNLMVDGKYLVYEWNAEGFAFDGNKVSFGWNTEVAKKDFIYGDVIVRNGTRVLNPTFATGTDGWKEQTAIGITKQGYLWLFSTTSKMYAKNLYTYALAHSDMQFAMKLDGGLSSQWSCEKETYNSARNFVHNYICVWVDKQTEVPKETATVSTNYTVCIDPGHGGTDNTNGAENYREHEFTLALGKKVKALLEKNNVSVLMTRETDKTVSLAERYTMANNASVKYYVSLHSNASSTTSTRGLCVYVATNASSNSTALAQKIITNAKSSGVKVFGNELYKQNFAVVYYTKMPAVLIECGFHTNADDRALLASYSYQNTLADVIAKSICQQLGVSYTANTAQETKPDGYDAWLKCYEYHSKNP